MPVCLVRLPHALAFGTVHATGEQHGGGAEWFSGQMLPAITTCIHHDKIDSIMRTLHARAKATDQCTPHIVPLSCSRCLDAGTSQPAPSKTFMERDGRVRPHVRPIPGKWGKGYTARRKLHRNTCIVHGIITTAHACLQHWHIKCPWIT